MSIIQIIVVIGLVAFVIFGLWLQFYIRRCHNSNAMGHAKRLREWIKRNSKRAKELGYMHKEKNDVTE